MNALRVAGTRLSALFRRVEVDQELDDELRFHLTMRAQEHARGGMTPAEAARHAGRQFGNFNSIKDACRDFSGGGSLERLLDDVRFAWRMLAKDRSFTVMAALTLALAMAANTAVFIVANSVLFRPLPFPDAHELVAVRQHAASGPSGSRRLSIPEFRDYKAEASWFDEMALCYSQAFITTHPDGSVAMVRGSLVSSGMFSLLGVPPLLGRVFLPEDDQPGSRVAMISYELWQRRFNGAAAAIGATLTLDSEEYRIVGVMPPRFRFPIANEPTDVWTILATTHEQTPGGGPGSASRDNRVFNAIARLKSGSSHAQANAGQKEIAARLAALHSTDLNSCTTMPYHEFVTGLVRPELIMLSIAALCFLGVACANVANLLLVRSASRDKESAIRAALGAGRGRIFRQLLIEGLILAAIASLLGLLTSFAAAPFIASLLPADFPRAYEVGVDGTVLAFAAGMVVLIGCLFAAATAWRSARSPLAPLLNECSRGSDRNAGSQRFRSGLVAVELVLAFVLLSGAAFFLRGVHRLRATDPGFQPRGIITAKVSRQEVEPWEPVQSAAFVQQVTARASALPDVQSASAASHVPFRPRKTITELIGVPTSASGLPVTPFSVVTPNYFRTLDIPFIRGRDFDERDTRDAPPVVIINESLARDLFGNENPIGKRLHPKLAAFDGDYLEREVIGVVQDIQSHPQITRQRPEFYVAHAQMPMNGMALLVRSETSIAIMAERMRAAVASVDRTALFHERGTVEDHMDASLARPRMNSVVLAAFAVVGVSLALVGMYGVLGYSVAQQRHEFGIRLALGAEKSASSRLVVGQGARLMGWSLAAGVLCSLAVRPFLRSFGPSSAASDAALLLAVALFVAVLALVACWLPARRAANLDPLHALAQR